jgi:hypothetical protein
VPHVAAAIFGLIGVLVGGLITFATTVYLQGRQDRSALRSIARLAYDDCLHFQSTLVRALASKEWWSAGEVMTLQVDKDDRKFLLGQLDDAASQDVAGAIGWMTYLTLRCREAKLAPLPAEFTMMRDTFCRLDAARWQLSGKVSGRRFRSFADGAVLNTVEPPRTLEELEICDERCRERRKLNYGGKVAP